MDISQLAAFLAPLVPYLIKGGIEMAKAAAGKLGEKITAESWDGLESLWDKIRKKAEKKPAFEDAIRKAEARPEDERVHKTLELQLEDLLQEEPTLAKEAQIIVGQIVNLSVREGSVVGPTAESQIATGDRNIQVGRDWLQVFLAQSPGTPVSNLPPEALTHAYLRGLAYECSQLPLGIVDPRFLQAGGDDSISLPSIYIDLDVQPPMREERAAKQRAILEEGERLERIPVLKALTQTELRRVVLLGDPGSGKTTCIHYLTYALAQIQQGNSTAGDLLPSDWPLRHLFPVRLVLREVAARHIPVKATKGTAEMLWQALQSDLASRLGNDAAKVLFPALQTRLLKESCLILLDGLDEVPEADQRRTRLIEAVSHFVAAMPVQSHVIVTARPYAYTGKWHLSGFTTVTLLSFSPEQIERFIDRWYQAVRAVMQWDEATATGRGAGLVQAISEKPYLSDLAARPLLLTLMATLHTSWGKLPEDRADLYEETVKLLLDRWQRWREVRAEDGSVVTEPGIAKALSVEESKIRTALHNLAYAVHLRQGQEPARKDTPADILEGEVLTAFTPLLPEDTNPKVILSYLETRAGLLLGRGGGIYTFPHRSFQEYLAACYLADQPDPACELCRVVQEDPSWWREVFLLGVGKIRKGGLGNAVNAANTLIPCAPEETGQVTEKDWQVAALAGQALVEMRLVEKSSEQPLYDTILKKSRNWLVSLIEGGHLDARERAAAGDTLARLGDPRPGVIPHLPVGEGTGGETLNLLFCEIPAGKFLMGSKKGETDSFDGEYPQFPYDIPYDYYLARYPVTNAQFEAFVNDPGGYVKKDWWTKTDWERRGDRPGPPKQGGVFDLPNHPVVNVAWYEAHAFTRWLTEKLPAEGFRLQIWRRDKIETVNLEAKKWEARLPSEAEWEKAARGENGQRYPWGEEPDPHRANYDETGIGATSAVGCFPGGASPYGLLDMSGNAWEWCATQWRDNYEGYKENNQPEGGVPRVVRGGAFGYGVRDVRGACRLRLSPDRWLRDRGFRVVVSPVLNSEL